MRIAWEGAEFAPRAWQKDALPKVLEHIDSRADKGGIVEAVMGAGKSVLIAEVVAMRASEEPAIVVVAPAKALVLQIAATLRKRIGSARVGCYFSDLKQPDRDVVVCCNPSLARLAKCLKRPCSLMIFDEAHRSEAASVLSAAEEIAPASILGFSATPYRSISSQKLSLYGKVLVSYSFSDAIRDGVLVPLRAVTWNAQRAEEWGISPEADRDEVSLAMIRQGQGAGVASADTKKDAREFAECLEEHGIAADFVTGEHSSEERAAIMERLRIGEIKCVVHVNVLTEGVDFPWLQWICLRRSGSSKIRFPQEIGRVLRAHPGKDHALVFDPTGITLERAMEMPAGIWQPVEGVALMPEDKRELRAMRRWLKARSQNYAEAHDFNAMMDALQASGAERALVYSARSLTFDQRVFVKGALSGCEGKEEKVVRIELVDRQALDAVLWLSPRCPPGAKEHALQWLRGRGHPCLGVVEGGSLAVAQNMGLTAPILAKDEYSHPAFVVAVFGDGAMLEETQLAIEASGRKVITYKAAKEREEREARLMGSHESFLIESLIAVASRGFVSRRILPEKIRNMSMLKDQSSLIRKHMSSVNGWKASAPVDKIDLLRECVRAGLSMRLTRGMARDLISLLIGLQKAGSWVC